MPINVMNHSFHVTSVLYFLQFPAQVRPWSHFVNKETQRCLIYGQQIYRAHFSTNHFPKNVTEGRFLILENDQNVM